MTVATLKTLQRERCMSIRDLRRNPIRACRGITRIIEGAKTHGYVLSPRALDNLIEDVEALSSPTFLASIREARRDVAAGRVYSATAARRMLGIPRRRRRAGTS